MEKKKTTKTIIDNTIQELMSYLDELNATHKITNKELQERLVWVQTNESDERIDELTKNIYSIEEEQERVKKTIRPLQSYVDKLYRNKEDFTDAITEKFLSENDKVKEFGFFTGEEYSLMLEVVVYHKLFADEIKEDLRHRGYEFVYDDIMIIDEEEQYYCMYFKEY